MGGFRPSNASGQSGFQRQGSINLGPGGRFGQSFNRFQGGSGGGSQGGNFGINSAANNDPYVQQILQTMATTINQHCHQFMLNAPEQFFSDFDAFAGRQFEDWEL